MFLYDSASEKHENSTNPRWIFFYNQVEREMMSKKCRERERVREMCYLFV